MIEYYPIIKILILTTLSFVVAFSFTPLLIHLMYKYKLGKRIRDSKSAPVFAKIHKQKAGTPTVGGILIWLTALVFAVVFYLVSIFTENDFIKNLNFLTRPETLLPLGALVASALVGLVDDYLNIKGIGPKGGGLRVRFKLLVYTAIAVVGAWWFYYKLDWDIIGVPFVGTFEIGWWIIPIFIFIIVATSNSVNLTDGLDGLAGGILLINFATFAVFAFALGRVDLATFCGVICGALLAFLWFNINPAKFFMGDNASMSLGVTLGLVAMLTNTVLLLPLIGIIFVIESLSVIIQVGSKKLRKGKKVFLSAPFHHHLQAKGWPEQKIVMRLWLISFVVAVWAIIIFLIDMR